MCRFVLLAITALLLSTTLPNVFSIAATVPSSAESLEQEDYDSDSDDDDENVTISEVSPSPETVTEITWFTYGDDDPLGPLHWRNKDLANKLLSPLTKERSWQRALRMHEERHKGSFHKTTTLPPRLQQLYVNNFCQTNWLSPINIQTSKIHTPEDNKNRVLLTEEASRTPETLTLKINQPNIQQSVWLFGHPETYHGIEIRSRTLDQIYLTDNFDPFAQTDAFTKYDFSFLTLFYCDLHKASPYRTMHQIDGKRFPLELEFVFLRTITAQDVPRFFLSAQQDDDDVNVEKDAMLGLYGGDKVATIVTVIAELGPESNRYFQPVIDAAKKFQGSDVQDDNYELNVVVVEPPWSPTWLLPDSSDYYYYDDASFPVPPCWKVARYYILREHITISREQLEILTHIRTDREKSTRGLLPCTHSISVVYNDTLIGGETPIFLNPIEYEVMGNDDEKPRTEEEINQKKERRHKREVFRKRLAGNVVKLREGTVFVEEQDNEGISKNAAVAGTKHKTSNSKIMTMQKYLLGFMLVSMHLIVFWWSFAFYHFNSL